MVNTMKKLNIYLTEKLKISKIHYTCQPKDKHELCKILKERLAKDKNANLNDINVSEITDMSRLFVNYNPHNIDISQWDVSNVKDMEDMFFDCENFNCDLSNWDVSKVENMSFMFYCCKKFNSDLHDWDVSNIRNMRNMFYNCTSLKNKPSWYINHK